MKELICAIMFLLSLPAASVHAQAFKEMTFFELSAGSGVKHHGITPVDFSFKLHVRVKSLSTLGSPDWKRNTYDASLAWYLKTEKFSPIVELGYRYLDSRTKGIDNYGNAYLTIGLRY